MPKERWIHYPGTEGGIDASPVIAWADWGHAVDPEFGGRISTPYQQSRDEESRALGPSEEEIAGVRLGGGCAAARQKACVHPVS